MATAPGALLALIEPDKSTITHRYYSRESQVSSPLIG